MLWTDLIYWWNHFLMAGWECFYVYLAVWHMQLTPIKTQIYFCSLFSLLMIGLFYREMCVKDPNLLSAVHKAGGWSEARLVMRARLRLDLKLSDDIKREKGKKKTQQAQTESLIKRSNIHGCSDYSCTIGWISAAKRARACVCTQSNSNYELVDTLSAP